MKEADLLGGFSLADVAPQIKCPVNSISDRNDTTGLQSNSPGSSFLILVVRAHRFSVLLKERAKLCLVFKTKWYNLGYYLSVFFMVDLLRANGSSFHREPGRSGPTSSSS